MCVVCTMYVCPWNRQRGEEEEEEEEEGEEERKTLFILPEWPFTLPQQKRHACSGAQQITPSLVSLSSFCPPAAAVAAAAGGGAGNNDGTGAHLEVVQGVSV